MPSISIGNDPPLRRNQIEILVVESNPADTRLTEEAFRTAGMTSGFRSVTDGADALDYVHKRGKYEHVTTPDVIFLDLSLPRVSGLGLEGHQIDSQFNAHTDSRRFRIRRSRRG